MFRKILIANRGEIALRIIRACQELDIAIVAVYSEADANALHVVLADEAVSIGPSAPAESYLCGDKIIEAAQRLGCDAIHPGYGFLAENADFAEAVTKAGLTWIGPGAAAMRVMGSKVAARSAMAAAGVPIIPGYQASNVDADLMAAAQAIGLPLLVKAASGGGGKGMRIVRRMKDLPAALQSARREAMNAFGDDQLYLEKLIERAHHIEFQIFGDQFGNVIHLFERECSIQRRHQKISEETPSPLLKEDLRRRMGAAAVAAARAVNYVNAGTVEFLVDETGSFYFLEMNTRLQVEHPITELVTGIDLVKAQIRVAAGEPLPFQQEQVQPRGHAIECRVYAEDPGNHFLPATGKVLLAVEPTGPGVRVDAGVGSGDEITLHYDPLIAKLAVLGANRQDAIAKLDRALREYVILGEVITNLSFLRSLLRHEGFRHGQTTTDFVEQKFGHWQPPLAFPPDPVLIAAALAEFLENGGTSSEAAQVVLSGDAYSPWRSQDRFRLGTQNPTLPLSLRRSAAAPNSAARGRELMRDRKSNFVHPSTAPLPDPYRAGLGEGEPYQYQLAHEIKQVQVEREAEQFRVKLGNGVYTVQAKSGHHGRLELAIDGRRLLAYVVRGDASANSRLYIWLDGETWTLQHPTASKSKPRTHLDNDRGSLTAVMPGVVTKVLVAEGDQIARGDPLVILEAMKMELRIAAPHAGQVGKVYCSPGQVVERGQLLVDLTPITDESK